MKRTSLVRGVVRGQRGAVMPLVGFIIIALLALAAIAVDVGYILVTKQQLQNAVDASVLAAAPAMILEEPEKTTEVHALVVDMCGRHRAGDDASVSILPAEDIIIEDNKVTVYARKLRDRGNGLPLFFARILGIRYADVTAKAALEVYTSSSACCVKPWAIADLWDDETPIVGYPAWQNNERWDGEQFDDLNGNRLWDEGESFEDENGNGVYDSEYYSRDLSQDNLAGYIPELPPTGHVGMQLKLKVASKFDRASSSYFNPVVLPWPEDYGYPDRGANRYERSIVECNPTVIEQGTELLLESEPGRMVGPTNHGAKELILEDPTAYWNDQLNTVDHHGGGGILGVSPRIIMIPVYDPRIWPGTGRLQDENSIYITKIAAFFLEDLKQDVVIGRVSKAPVSCTDPVSPGGGTSFTWTYQLVE
ncbi:MAG: Tad domain-containing protein [Candidatus Eiseniibacteriota bacterium]|nr:MAG: Tad domain-containing protein [Candidatus Eisenbacteria bacterium]